MSTPFIDGYKDTDLLLSQGFSLQMTRALVMCSLSTTVGEGQEEYMRGHIFRRAADEGKIKMPKGCKGKVIRDLFIKIKTEG